MSYNYNITIRNQGYSTTNNNATSTTSDAWTNPDCYDHTNTVDTIDDCGFWTTNNNNNNVDELSDCMFFNIQS